MRIGAIKLQEWLRLKDKKPSHFANDIGKYPSTMTRILDGFNCPDMDTAALIEKQTEGYVTLADWTIEYVKKKTAKQK